MGEDGITGHRMQHADRGQCLPEMIIEQNKNITRGGEIIPMTHVEDRDTGGTDRPTSASDGESLELTAEQIQRLDNCILQMRKAWDERFDLRRPEFLKRYLRGDSWVHCHAFWAGEFESQHLCATFGCPNQSIAPAFWEDCEFVLLDHVSVRAIQTESVWNVRETSGNDEQFVFVDIVKVMKDGQRVVTGLHSVVRLRPLDHCLCGTGDALYYSARNGIFVFLPREANGELNFEIRRFASQQNKLPNQVVQTGPEMTKNFSGANREIERRIGWAEHAHDILSSIVVNIRPDIVRVECKKMGGQLVQAVDVLVGPLNLRPTPVEWM
jgi:hypothetical protein